LRSPQSCPHTRLPLPLTRPTSDPALDTFKLEYLLLPCFLLSLLFTYSYTPTEILWAFSIYLEAVAILPQLFMLTRTGEAETITTHYLAALGMYRAMYIPNWIYRSVSNERCLIGAGREDVGGNAAVRLRERRELSRVSSYERILGAPMGSLEPEGALWEREPPYTRVTSPSIQQKLTRSSFLFSPMRPPFHRYFSEDTIDPIAVVAGLVQTALYVDFCSSFPLFPTSCFT
jgi:hypothetical protein